MLVIDYFNGQAFWDTKKEVWVSSIDYLAEILNDATPYKNITVSTTFIKDGVEGFVLKAIKKVLPDIKVLIFEPESPPPEVKGVVY